MNSPSRRLGIVFLCAAFILPGCRDPENVLQVARGESFSISESEELWFGEELLGLRPRFYARTSDADAQAIIKDAKVVLPDGIVLEKHNISITRSKVSAGVRILHGVRGRITTRYYAEGYRVDVSCTVSVSEGCPTGDKTVLKPAKA